VGAHRRIAEACGRFEEAWRAGSRPRIEDFLGADRQGDEQRALHRDLLEAELCYRRQAGEAVHLDEYLARFPEQAELVQQVFAALTIGHTAPHPSPKAGPVPATGGPAGIGPVAASSQACLGRYQITATLGKGAFGVVYKARDEGLARDVAIKVPRRDLVERLGGIDAYLQEARVVASLKHPHIVPVHDIGYTDDGLCYVVYELIDGCDLRARLETGPGFSAAEAATLVALLAEALAYAHAHENRIKHRDIKPANILIDRFGKPYLTDFGLAQRHEDYGTGPGLAGTPAYMSPEQARRESHRVDGRADIFSLGIVFYELLTGRRAFTGAPEQVLARIADGDLEPPRQLSPALPVELERICLKAAARQLRDRYTTAADLAADLRAWLDREAVAATVAAEAMPVAAAPPAAVSSDPEPVRIVPRGLRSFDARDADFFLELLPGPRERDGLPRGVHFWKARLECPDGEATFAVGLLYGPSGCGKSSLVKAGLLPRLAAHVLPVYVEATPEETEARLLRGLRRACPALEGGLDLVDTVDALRRGRGLPPGHKVVLILDQFEQWLHGRRAEESPPLVRALRHCNGGRVQALVLVRDDFWMAVTRFFREDLELPVREDDSSAAVDLFDPRHADKVLAAFGRAYAALSADGALNEDNRQFLDAAVQGLAEAGRIIPVRLALFAEMVKERPWQPATLRAVGGVGGVGVRFLEETFNVATAPPRYRLHKPAACAVLKALLPDKRSRLKGHRRSRADLLAASGYAGRPSDFAELLDVLDHDLRLITPTGPEGAPETAEGEQCYQLTHDYLVPALREWLTAEQRKTRGGRAELRLVELAAWYEDKPEARRLPSWWEWLNIRLLTRKNNWTAPQKRLMGKAARYHFVWGAAILLLLGLVGWGAFEGMSYLEARNRVNALASAEMARAPDHVEALQGHRRWGNWLLRRRLAQAPSDQERLRLALGLVPVDPSQIDYLLEQLLTAPPPAVPVIRDALRPYQEKVADRLWPLLQNRTAPASTRLRAAAALAAYQPDDTRWPDVGQDIVNQLVKESTLEVGSWSKALRPVAVALTPALEKVFRATDRPEVERRLATDVLADYAADRPEVLAVLLQDADEKQFAVLYPKVVLHRERVVSILNETVNTRLTSRRTADEKEALAKRQGNAGVALLRLGQPERVWPLLARSADPRARSYLVHRLAPLGAGPVALLERLEQEKEVSIRRALLLALGELGPDRLSPAEGKRLLAGAWKRYQEEPDAGLHGAAEWLLRRWKQDRQLKEHEQGWVKDRKKREARQRVIREELKKAGAVPSGLGGKWYVNGQGQTMVVVPGPVEFLMGSPVTEAGREGGPRGKPETPHLKRVDQTFAIAAHEVTVGQFRELRKFRKAHHYNETYSGSDDHPVNSVSWYDAAAYCNWLSAQEGISEKQWCYEPKKGKGARDWSEEAYGEGMKLKANYLALEGYRLPSEAEWELACRAGSRTSRYYGETEELLGRYAWYTKVSQDQWMLPVGSLKPNDLGLFDMLGNAAEWCQERALYQPSRGASEDVGGARTIDSHTHWILRGGSFGNLGVDIRSAMRSRRAPAIRGDFVGFRPARTFK
jgi:formylglycine-generating enzyme required for sulfatase activity